jgi:hypothetical protein
VANNDRFDEHNLVLENIVVEYRLGNAVSTPDPFFNP